MPPTESRRRPKWTAEAPSLPNARRHLERTTRPKILHSLVIELHVCHCAPRHQKDAPGSLQRAGVACRHRNSKAARDHPPRTPSTRAEAACHSPGSQRTALEATPDPARTGRAANVAPQCRLQPPKSRGPAREYPRIEAFQPSNAHETPAQAAAGEHHAARLVRPTHRLHEGRDAALELLSALWCHALVVGLRHGARSNEPVQRGQDNDVGLTAARPLVRTQRLPQSRRGRSPRRVLRDRASCPCRAWDEGACVRLRHAIQYGESRT